MSWEEEYRAKHEEEEELTFGRVRNLQTEVKRLEGELRRRHRKTVAISWIIAIAVIVLTAWYYSR